MTGAGMRGSEMHTQLVIRSPQASTKLLRVVPVVLEELLGLIPSELCEKQHPKEVEVSVINDNLLLY